MARRFKVRQLSDGINLTEKKRKGASYMSLLCVCAQLTLQTEHQPLVRVVRHQTNQLQPPLDLWAHTHKKKKKIKCSVIKLEQAKQVYCGRVQLTDLNQDEGNKCNGPFNLPVQQKQHR